MSKYDPLRDYLIEQTEDCLCMRFNEIEKVLGFDLPVSARKRAQWWGNDEGHSQAKSWIYAGSKARDVDLFLETVTFERYDTFPQELKLQGDYNIAKRARFEEKQKRIQRDEKTLEQIGKTAKVGGAIALSALLGVCAI